MVLIAGAWLAAGLRWRRSALVALFLLAAAGVVTNLALLRDDGGLNRFEAIQQRAILAGIEIAGPNADPSYVPDDGPQAIRFCVRADEYHRGLPRRRRSLWVDRVLAGAGPRARRAAQRAHRPVPGRCAGAGPDPVPRSAPRRGLRRSRPDPGRDAVARAGARADARSRVRSSRRRQGRPLRRRRRASTSAPCSRARSRPWRCLPIRSRTHGTSPRRRRPAPASAGEPNTCANPCPDLDSNHEGAAQKRPEQVTPVWSWV